MIAQDGPGMQLGGARLTPHSREVLQRAIDRLDGKTGQVDRLVYDADDGLWSVRIKKNDAKKIEVVWRFVC